MLSGAHLFRQQGSKYEINPKVNVIRAEWCRAFTIGHMALEATAKTMHFKGNRELWGHFSKAATWS